MTTFQLEKWADLERDGQEIFPIHYAELSLHKDKIPLGMDFGMYRNMETAGILLVLTARSDGKLIGYYIALILRNHPHNKDAGPASTCDMFYILPEYRRGGTGAKLLIAAEEQLRKRGVRKASMSVKLHQDHSELLCALGWEKTDMVLQKVLD